VAIAAANERAEKEINAQMESFKEAQRVKKEKLDAAEAARDAQACPSRVLCKLSYIVGSLRKRYDPRAWDDPCQLGWELSGGLPVVDVVAS
jgi:hypothetical protein